MDPFLEASTQGNGTTNTSTKNGTYAAPFSISDSGSFGRQADAALITSINGVSLSDGDEIRIKGLPFSTLFESHGNVYSANATYSEHRARFEPISGNTDFDATISATKSSLFAFQNSDISSYLPGWSHPLFFAAFYYSDSSNLYCNLAPFNFSVIDQQLGYDSSSSTGIELFRLKDTYANVMNKGANRWYWASYGNIVKISAGWTSETEQNGFSILEPYNTSNYLYSYWLYSSSCKTHFDCERLVVCNAPRASAGSNNNLYFYLDNCRTIGTAKDHVTPIFANSMHRTDYYYPACGTNDTTTFPLVTGSDDQRSGLLRISNDHTVTVNREVTWKNIITPGYVYFNSDHATCVQKFGNMYCRSTSDGTVGRPMVHASTTSYGYNITFLQNSVYFLTSDNTSQDIVLEPDPLYKDYDTYTGSVTWETGLKKPGIAPLSNLSSSSNQYGPDRAGTAYSFPLFAETREISSNNNWFDSVLSRDGTSPIAYGSLGKLICNGNDYRTTGHNISVFTQSAASASGAPKFAIWSSEHNDYDGNPISIISDPYTAGLTYGSLLYNDIVDSTSCLVGQSNAYSIASGHGWIPLELAVPSYTAGSSNLRVTVSAAYYTAGTGQEKIVIYAWHRDTTQSNNFRYYTSGDHTISSTDVTSPTTVTLNLTNVPTSGQQDITSVIVGIGLKFEGTSLLQKFYITNAAIETY
jgi:hypothetical protein